MGAEALEALRAKASDATRRLVSVKLRAPEPLLWHGESVLLDGRRAGEVTSAAFGATVGAPVGLAWIHAEVPLTPTMLDAADVHIEVRGDPFPAVASIQPFYDPEGLRLRM